jgi:cytochrome b6-f complex iron-sulfur subunit
MTERSIEPDAGVSSRRRFIVGVWIGLGAVFLAEMIWIAVSFLRPRSRRRAAEALGSLVVAGPVERFEPGSVTAFREGRFYLVRLADGGFLALYRKCTHLGCTVPWIAEQQRFVCPCHASAFDLRGDVLSPPALRALDLFPVRIENGIVKVDTSAPVKRSAFHPSQVARA